MRNLAWMHTNSAWNETKAFHQFTSLARDSVNSSDVVKWLVDRVAGTFVTAICAVYLLTDSGRFRLSACRGLIPPSVEMELDADTQAVLSSRRVVGSTDPTYLLLVPIIRPLAAHGTDKTSRTIIEGILAVTLPSSRVVHSSERMVLLSLADQAAAALSLFRLSQEARFHARRYTVAETLRSLTSQMSSTLDPEEVINRTLVGLQELTDCDRVTFLRVEKSHLVSEAMWAAHETDVIHQTRLRKLDDCPWLLGLSHSRALFAVPDIQSDDHFRDYGDSKVRSWIGVPLVDKYDQLLAIIILEYFAVYSFSAQILQLIHTFTGDAISTLQNAWTFKALERLAGTDELTGVYNRREFFARAQRELERAKRYGGSTSIILLDVDSFKTVNDRYGHAVGDDVLRSIIQRCCQQLRTMDIIGRYGGDEFVILLPETSLAAAQYVAERLRWYIERVPITTGAGTLNMAISVGTTSVAPDDTDVTAALQRADTAMYQTRQLKHREMQSS